MTPVIAMMRTTGYSLAITGVMQVDGRIRATGVHTPDEAVAVHDYLDWVKPRGAEMQGVTSANPAITPPRDTKPHSPRRANVALAQSLQLVAYASSARCH